MMIVEFLLARIAEDEHQAHEAIKLRRRVFGDRDKPDRELNCYDDLGTPAVVVGGERVLAECAAKRRIINHHQYDHIGGAHLCQDTMVSDAQCEVLRALASVYADHTDYDQPWA